MRIGILGCGVMGSAFARRLKEGGQSLLLFDRNANRLKRLTDELGAEKASSEREVATQCDVLLLAVKPKDLKQLAKDIGPLEGQIILSILAGSATSELKKLFPGCDIVRSMPNLALTVGQSVIALVEDPELPSDVKEKINHLLEGMGLAFWTEEGKIEGITALAGSGPAFVIGVIESMIESGIAMGLRRDEAQKLALQTVLGSLELIKANPGHPAEVRWQICAPGGTTIAGMHAFEEEGVRRGIMNTFLAAYDRAKEMK